MKFSRMNDGIVLVDDQSRVTPIRAIIGIGRNYAEHAREQAADIPTRPMLFTKNLAALCLNGEDVVIPRVCQDRPQVDYEGELGVILGARGSARDIDEHDALSHVLAYCVCNDVSARWWQKEGGGGQFYRGKSFDTFCPVGSPVAGGNVRDPQSLRILTRVNGVVKQDASTGDMIFPVARLIHEVSRGHTILPGTLVLSGTPGGVGFARTPPEWLKEGDEVRIEIPGVGELVNRVREEK